MNKNEEELIKELLQSGSSSEEIKELLSVMRKLSQVSPIQRSETFKKQTLRTLLPATERKKWFVWPRFFAPALAMLFLIFVGATSVLAAQGALPGESLYPLKRWSEKVAVLVMPSFRDNIPLRRSEEVKDLVEQKKDFGLFKRTLDEYEKELEKQGDKEVSSTSDGRKNLEEAREKASSEERKELEETLKRTEEKDKGNDDEGKVESEKSSPGDKHKDDKRDEDKDEDD